MYVHPDDISEFVPIDKPNVARMYDYHLGGFHYFDVDQQAAEQMLAFFPDLKQIMWANRAFLRRAIAFLHTQGIDQFLDIGSGLPTVGNVHEMAQARNPAARVVYVDIDPVAVEYSKALLRGNPHATAIRGDVRYPDLILKRPEVQQLLDFRRPVAVMLVAVLHFVADDAQAYQSVRSLREAMPAGSYLVISHATHEKVPPEVVTRSEQIYARSTIPFKTRLRHEVAGFFDGLMLVEPGLVYAPAWRPKTAKDVFFDEPERACNFAGVACKV